MSNQFVDDPMWHRKTALRPLVENGHEFFEVEFRNEAFKDLKKKKGASVFLCVGTNCLMNE